MFMDLDDILIPRAGLTYFEEFAAMIHGNEFIHYKKENVYYETSGCSSSIGVCRLVQAMLHKLFPRLIFFTLPDFWMW